MTHWIAKLQLDSNQGGAANFCMQKFLTGLAGLVYLYIMFVFYLDQ